MLTSAQTSPSLNEHLNEPSNAAFSHPGRSAADHFSHILCIAASTSQCSLLLKTPAASFAWRSQQVNQHSEQLLPAVAQLLLQAGLSKPDLIAVDIGPGAFTSVRVACGAAQGLALGWDCPAYGVDSLTALAHQALAIKPHLRTVSCVIDARMNECYVAKFALLSGDLKQTHAPTLVPYEAVMDLNTDTVIGNASAVLPQWHTLANEATASGRVIDDAPSAQGVLAATLLALQAGVKPCLPEGLQPLYVRDQVALTTEQRLAAALAK